MPSLQAQLTSFAVLSFVFLGHATEFDGLWVYKYSNRESPHSGDYYQKISPSSAMIDLIKTDGPPNSTWVASWKHPHSEHYLSLYRDLINSHWRDQPVVSNGELRISCAKDIAPSKLAFLVDVSLMDQMQIGIRKETFPRVDEKQRLQSVSRSSFRKFDDYSYAISGLSELSSLITTGRDYGALQIRRMKSIWNQYRLHLLFINKLRFWILKIWDRAEIIKNSSGDDMADNDFVNLLNALNIHSIGISELDIPPMNRYPVEYKLLVLTSRGLMQYLAPTMTMNIQLDGEPEFETVIWMRTPVDYRWVPFFIDLYRNIMTNYLKIPDVRILYYLPDQDWRKKKVLELMDCCGLILWSETITDSMLRYIYLEENDCMIGKLFIDYVQLQNLFFKGSSIPPYFPNTSISTSSMATRFMTELVDKFHPSDVDQVLDLFLDIKQALTK